MSDINTNGVTPTELKTLKYFALYCQSNGSDSVYRMYYLDDCSIDSSEDDWFSEDSNRNIESYDRIDTVIEKIINDNNLTDFVSDCYNRGSLRVNIDCKGRTLSIEGWEVVYGSDNYLSEYDLKEIEETYGEETLKSVEELFNRLEEMGEEATVAFSGGGDDGYIEDNMVINETDHPIPKLIEDMLYNMLNGSHPGWENNEGGQGGWTFRPDYKIVEFDFNYNTEDEVYLNELNYSLDF
jgi:hypothetical protein